MINAVCARVGLTWENGVSDGASRTGSFFCYVFGKREVGWSRIQVAELLVSKSMDHENLCDMVDEYR